MDKELLKEQLKKQQNKQEVYTPADGRNVGLNRIYFFQRIADSFIFPVDSELQAHHMLRRKDFNQKFKYIGWSNGEHFAKYKMLPPTRMKLDDQANITAEGRDDVNLRMGTFNEVMEKELEAAIDNPDRTPPRDFRSRDLNGNISNSQMSGWLNMMR
jgi:hypothetical protein